MMQNLTIVLAILVCLTLFLQSVDSRAVGRRQDLEDCQSDLKCLAGYTCMLDVKKCNQVFKRREDSEDEDTEDSSADSGRMCPNGWTLYENSCYFKSTASQSWNASQAECTSYGGNLLTINSEAENNFTKQTLVGNFEYWIGFADYNVEADFAWSSGQPVTFTQNFAFPNNGAYDCSYLRSGNNLWNIGHCDTDRGFICEAPL